MPRKIKWVELDRDADYRVRQRVMSGRMTPARHLAIKQWCEANTWRENCGHEWDCCGCHFADYATYEHKYNQLTITVTSSYNY